MTIIGLFCSLVLALVKVGSGSPMPWWYLAIPPAIGFGMELTVFVVRSFK